LENKKNGQKTKNNNNANNIIKESFNKKKKTILQIGCQKKEKYNNIK
jgi:hypothetical protein